MFIAVDIGNTQTTIGVYEGETLAAAVHLPSTSRLPKRKFFKKLKTLLAETGIAIKRIDGVGISSVVPKLTDVYTTFFLKGFRKKPLVIHGDMDLGITLRYADPLTLGTDRICTAIAGYKKFGGPLIIIDFGTATTYDIAAPNGDFLGGVIAPGVETAASALHRRTAQLPRVGVHLPESVIRTDTISSIQAGVFWGAIDAASGMVARLQKEIQQSYSTKAVVIATGGFSKFIAEHSQFIDHVEASLVLDGIRLIFDRVRRPKK